MSGDDIVCFYLPKEYFKITEYHRGFVHLERLCRDNFLPPEKAGYGPCFHLVGLLLLNSGWKFALIFLRIPAPLLTFFCWALWKFHARQELALSADLLYIAPAVCLTLLTAWSANHGFQAPKETSNNSILFFQAFRVPLFYKGRSWPKAIFRGVLKKGIPRLSCVLNENPRQRPPSAWRRDRSFGISRLFY